MPCAASGSSFFGVAAARERLVVERLRVPLERLLVLRLLAVLLRAVLRLDELRLDVDLRVVLFLRSAIPLQSFRQGLG
jgi:hypothetical protein